MGGGGRDSILCNRAFDRRIERAPGDRVVMGDRDARGVRALFGGLSDAAASSARGVFFRDAGLFLGRAKEVLASPAAPASRRRLSNISPAPTFFHLTRRYDDKWLALAEP